MLDIFVEGESKMKSFTKKIRNKKKIIKFLVILLVLGNSFNISGFFIGIYSDRQYNMANMNEPNEDSQVQVKTEDLYSDLNSEGQSEGKNLRSLESSIDSNIESEGDSLENPIDSHILLHTNETFQKDNVTTSAVPISIDSQLILNEVLKQRFPSGVFSSYFKFKGISRRLQDAGYLFFIYDLTLENNYSVENSICVSIDALVKIARAQADLEQIIIHSDEISHVLLERMKIHYNSKIQLAQMELIVDEFSLLVEKIPKINIQENCAIEIALNSGLTNPVIKGLIINEKINQICWKIKQEIPNIICVLICVETGEIEISYNSSTEYNIFAELRQEESDIETNLDTDTNITVDALDPPRNIKIKSGYPYIYSPRHGSSFLQSSSRKNVVFLWDNCWYIMVKVKNYESKDAKIRFLVELDWPDTWDWPIWYDYFGYTGSYTLEGGKTNYYIIKLDSAFLTGLITDDAVGKWRFTVSVECEESWWIFKWWERTDREEENFDVIFYNSPSNYLSANVLYHCYDKEIRRKSTSIFNSITIIDAVRNRDVAADRIRYWVATNIEYDLNYIDRSSDEDILSTGKGVCEDYANLYVSLCRSVGIQARYHFVALTRDDYVSTYYTVRTPDFGGPYYSDYIHAVAGWIGDSGSWRHCEPQNSWLGWDDPSSYLRDHTEYNNVIVRAYKNSWDGFYVSTGYALKLYPDPHYSYWEDRSSTYDATQPSDTTPPHISGISDYLYDSNLRISCYVSDNSRYVDSGMLFYTLDGTTWQNAEMKWLLSKYGGSTIYVDIDVSGAPKNIMEYYICVSDFSGNTKESTRRQAVTKVLGHIQNNFAGIIQQNQFIQAGTLDVPINSEKLEFVLDWPGSDLDLVVYDPTGNPLVHNPPNVVYSGNTKPEKLQVLNPQEGMYTMEVVGVNVSGDVSYTLITDILAPIAPEYQASITPQIDFLAMNAGEIRTVQIMIDNKGTKTDTYDLTLSGIPSEWYTLSSTSISLAPGSSKAIDLILNPPYHWSTKAMNYKFFLNLASAHIGISEAITLEVLPFRKVTIEDVSTEGCIEPGFYKEFSVNVINDGNTAGIFHINASAENPDWEWAIAGLPSSLAPGQSEECTIRISPSRVPTTTPGIYYVEFIVYYSEAPEVQKTVRLEIEVLPFYDFEAWIEPNYAQIDPGFTEKFNISIINLGNVQAEYLVSFLNFHDWISPQLLSANPLPGSIETFVFEITPLRHFSRSPGNRTIIALVEGNFEIDERYPNGPTILNLGKIVNTTIEILPFFDFEASIEPDHSQVKPGSIAKSNISIMNLGNIENSFLLDYYLKDFKSKYRALPTTLQESWLNNTIESVTLAPGEIFCFEVCIEIPEDWRGFENTIYELELTVTTEKAPLQVLNFSLLVESLLFNKLCYVDWQIEDLKEYINNSLTSCLSKILNCKLSFVQKHLQEAYSKIEAGAIICGLVHDDLAKLLISITEFKTEIFYKFGLISDEDAGYIINYTHVIRDNIVILMGSSVSIEQGYNVAVIEVDLLNLNDFIEAEMSWWNGRCLTRYIKSATIILEVAIFKISMDLDIEHTLTGAQCKLNRARYKINRLLNRGKISQELADILLLKIDHAIENIETIKNSL